MQTAVAEQATYTGPPPLTWSNVFTSWTLDVPALVFAIVLAAAYLLGMRSVAQRGGHWPRGRTAAFLGALAVLLLTSMSFLGVYAQVLAWTYAAQLALLLTLVPVLLALGHPIGLAVEVRPRVAGVSGSRVVRAVTFPLVGIALVTGLPFAIWFTSWYAASLEHTWAFALAHLSLVLVGFAFFWPLLSPDADRRLPWAAAVAVVFVESVLDALPGIVLWLRSTLLAPEYWNALNRPWGRTPLADQQLGGLVYWGIGEIVGLPILLVTVIGWMRADAKDAARIDAELDAQEAAEALRRTGDA